MNEHKPKNSTRGLIKVKDIIAISSCKGGVGKSTVAAHIAQELTSRNLKVGLVDADIYGPSVPTLFQMPDQHIDIDEKKQLVPILKDNLKIMSFGFLLGNAPAVMRGPIVTRYIQQILHNTNWDELDYLIIDMPPGTGDVQLTITQTVRLSGAVIVTTPHTLSLIDVARGILMFEKVNVPILGIIENMSYFIAPGSSEKHYIFGETGSRSLTDQFGVEMFGEIPVLPDLSQTIIKAPSNPYIVDIAERILKSVETLDRSLSALPQIYSDGQKITLSWADGKKDTVSNFELRLNSQDALSINEVTGEKLIKPENIRKDIKPDKITPLGNYAIGIEWNDGHKSGIYPYKLIKEIAHK